MCGIGVSKKRVSVIVALSLPTKIIYSPTEKTVLRLPAHRYTHMRTVQKDSEQSQLGALNSPAFKLYNSAQSKTAAKQHSDKAGSALRAR